MLEKSGQRWKESDNVGKNRTTFSVPIVRFFPTLLYSNYSPVIIVVISAAWSYWEFFICDHCVKFDASLTWKRGMTFAIKGVAVELKTPCFNGSLLEPSLVAIQLVMLTK